MMASASFFPPTLTLASSEQCHTGPWPNWSMCPAGTRPQLPRLLPWKGCKSSQHLAMPEYPDSFDCEKIQLVRKFWNLERLMTCTNPWTGFDVRPPTYALGLQILLTGPVQSHGFLTWPKTYQSNLGGICCPVISVFRTSPNVKGSPQSRKDDPTKKLQGYCLNSSSNLFQQQQQQWLSSHIHKGLIWRSAPSETLCISTIYLRDFAPIGTLLTLAIDHLHGFLRSESLSTAGCLHLSCCSALQAPSQRRHFHRAEKDSQHGSWNSKVSALHP